MDIAVLEDLGLSNAEARVYLALLDGPSKTGRIIDSTGLQSSTVYHVLGSLVEKGLASYILIGKVKHYQASDPGTLMLFLDDKRKKLKEILPELKARTDRVKQTARVYEGMKGMKAAFGDILETLKKGDQYYFFQVPRKLLHNRKIVRFFRNYHLKRSAKGIRVKGLSLPMNRTAMERIFQGMKHTRIRYLKEPTPNGIVIYRDKVITWEYDEKEGRPSAFVIESGMVARSYRRFFEQKWRQARA